MAVIKVFDSVGVKTVQLMGNLEEQPYDVISDQEFSDEDINKFAVETDEGF